MEGIFFSTLLLFFINGFAFNWTKVTESEQGNSFYVDINSIKKHNGFVYYWELTDYLEPLEGIANSSIVKYKVDCGEEKRTWLNDTYYSQSKGRGRIVEDNSNNIIDYPKPKEVRYTVMKFACNNARERTWGLLTFQQSPNILLYP